jgi:hypothetical protein
MKLSVAVRPSIPLNKQLFGASKFNELRYRRQPPKIGQTAPMGNRLFLVERLATRMRGLFRSGQTVSPQMHAT